MAGGAAPSLRPDGHDSPDAASILDALPAPVFVVDAKGRIAFVNGAAEQFFNIGASHLIGVALSVQVAPDGALCVLVARARASGATLIEHEMTIEGPRLGRHVAGVRAGPLVVAPGCVSVALFERVMASGVDLQTSRREAARPVAAMAAVLAHEVKNPLSGIRGAAQLLESGLAGADKDLARLICREVDRIAALVDRMGVFSEAPPMQREAVNLHQAIDHVRRIAETGFARDCRFVEGYDPSLPLAYGNRDAVVQIVLNLVKNAAEAAPRGVIRLTTTFRPGVRLAGAGGGAFLPLALSVEDNGPGIAEAVSGRLFEPFATTKADGRGLGLALAAKLMEELGGMIEHTSAPGRTVFTLRLPMAETEPRL